MHVLADATHTNLFFFYFCIFWHSPKGLGYTTQTDSDLNSGNVKFRISGGPFSRRVMPEN